MYPERTMCEVLNEMRKSFESRNFAGLLGLVEEVQTMGNRMEAAIEEKKKYQQYHEEAKAKYDEYEKFRKKVNKLKEEIKELEERRDELKGEINERILF